MFHRIQLFNYIRRYTHSHNSLPNKYVNIVKTDKPVIEDKINYIVTRLETIDLLIKVNYVFTLMFGWFSVFK